MKLSESILQFVWKYQLFRKEGLFTLSGKNLQIRRVGLHNLNEGPDFEHAFLIIDGISWVGNVEIHTSSSEWNNHNHQFNVAYNNVVLHVVNEYDVEIKREDGTIPETLILSSLIEPGVLNRYDSIMNSMHWIPCEKLIHTVEPFYIQQWFESLLFERFISKSAFVFQLLEEYRGDWEEVAYIMLARSFGFGVNADAFEQLARILPSGLLKKYSRDRKAIEALVFGQAGMLNDDFQEEYPQQLKKEFSYLCKIHKLKPMDSVNWKFLRMRPSGFPTTRLAQFAALCFSINHFFALIIEIENLDLWRIRFNSLIVNEYWSTHYHFKKETAKHNTALGKGAIDLILINTIALLLFSYGKYVGDSSFMDRSILFLESIKPENNRIIQKYTELQIRVQSAADTQALKQLKISYCDKKRCLNCEIGLQIIKR
jgi:hypothetical protein